MESVSITLKVYYEETFWVGVFERIENQQFSVFKIIFGLEPQDQDIYRMILKQYQSFVFSPPIDHAVKVHKMNPKKKTKNDSSRSFKCSFVNTITEGSIFAI